jgi:selenocysteine lyase/cysteine desulfurase
MPECEVTLARPFRISKCNKKTGAPGSGFLLLKRERLETHLATQDAGESNDPGSEQHE